ncbi:TadE/TadG family type IV pilus assembly protein [Methylobacterium nigriterrae]|uniref:TadE/TadG family type IV pilus assembly protein n=1 Tax=Methylobacterium nigriterrae TaxID=3127512 RepID=UPI00301361F8
MPRIAARLPLAALLRRAPRFPCEAGGVAAVEFALILPLLIALYLGAVETTRAIDNSRKFSLFARAVADLSGRAPMTTMDPIFSASAAILQPFDAGQVSIVVNAMGVEDENGTLSGFVCSSAANANATPRTQNAPAGQDGIPAVPPIYRFDGARYILAEVSMPYAPVIGSRIYAAIFGSTSLVFRQQIAWAERADGEIILPGGAACRNP